MHAGIHQQSDYASDLQVIGTLSHVIKYASTNNCSIVRHGCPSTHTQLSKPAVNVDHALWWVCRYQSWLEADGQQELVRSLTDRCEQELQQVCLYRWLLPILVWMSKQLREPADLLSEHCLFFNKGCLISLVQHANHCCPALNADHLYVNKTLTRLPT